MITGLNDVESKARWNVLHYGLCSIASETFSTWANLNKLERPVIRPMTAMRDTLKAVSVAIIGECRAIRTSSQPRRRTR